MSVGFFEMKVPPRRSSQISRSRHMIDERFVSTDSDVKLSESEEDEEDEAAMTDPQNQNMS